MTMKPILLVQIWGLGRCADCSNLELAPNLEAGQK